MSSDASLEYHLAELAIANDETNSRRTLPQIPPGVRRVLDVGCGVGQSLVALKLAPEVEAHGVDIDTAAVRFGKAHFASLNLAVSAGENLPYADNCFDLVFCRVSLPYMHVPGALAEFSRVLKDNGQLWLALHPMTMFRHDMWHALRNGNPRAVMYRMYALANSLLLAGGWQARYPFNRARMESYQMRSALKRALHRADFQAIRMWNEQDKSLATAARAPRVSR